MKSFLYASLAALCLSLVALIGFHLGSGSAEAQSREIIGYQVIEYRPSSTGSQNVVRHYILTANGDLYTGQGATDVGLGGTSYMGNVWAGVDEGR